MGLVQDFSLSAIEEYFNKHGQSIAMSFYNASARNVGTEIGSALHIGGTVYKNLGKAMPVIGCAIDFVRQIADGENAVDAVNKTAIHAMSGIIIGIGLSLFLSVTTPTLIGVGIGIIIGSAINEKLDALYDNKGKLFS
ncbi:hypothetical protein [Enterococcus sp. BWR-S5]|uniref:hypothetical protein n=1 Tax=Enterococcus sp. BWR-S5 TaxID=2787714 RepID=UPI001923244A|nr:hypothetical protein [Enterococcus sp. BWR-S5]MBL1226040.1 hypothetical protein [Enterococcus sp. BWR-S5]